MAAYELFTVCLRLLGFWVALSHAHGLVRFVAQFVMFRWGDYSTAPGSNRLLKDTIASCGSSVVLIGMGVALICLAPRIARRFHPDGEASDDSLSCGQLGLGGIYHIAAFLMGVYIATLAVTPLLFAFQFVIAETPMMPAGGIVVMLVQGGLYLVCGAILVFGSPAIGRVLGRLSSRELRAKLAYDPNALPNPQFTLKVVLVIITLAAIIFGILVWLAQSING